MPRVEAQVRCSARVLARHTLPAGRGIDAGVLEDLPDRGRRHGDAEPGQLAVDAAVTPRLVLPGKPQHHRPDLPVRCRAPGPALARPARPPAADDVPVPPQDGARSDDQPHRGETVDRQRPGQQGKQRPVRPRQPGTSPRPLTPGDSKLVAQHEDLGVLPPRLPARQAQQRHGTGNDQEDQLQAHKPKIIPPPVGPRPARRMPNARPRSAGPLPRWRRFSAPSGRRALGHRLCGALMGWRGPIRQPAPAAGTNKTSPPPSWSRTAEKPPPGMHGMYQSGEQFGCPRNGTKRAQIGKASGSTDRSFARTLFRHMSVTIATP